jgi:FkbM family methyltransferase
MLKTKIAENEDGKFIVLANDTLGKHLISGQRWEPYFTELVRAIVPEGTTVIDVGANIGYNAVILSKVTGDQGRVIAFEPLRIPFQQLCGNAVLNDLENIFPHNVVLGSVDNELVSMVPVDYHEEDINIMNACVGLGGEFVIMKTLDSYNLSNVSFLKIDVQGCELHVLMGSDATINKNRPVIFIEIEEPQLRNQNLSSQDVMMKILAMEYSLVYNQNLSLFDWVGVPSENTAMLNKVCAAMGSDHQVFSSAKA